MEDKPESEKEPKVRILDAACRLFSRHCYAATGMRDLAQEADVNLAAINYYFGSKHKILENLLEKYFHGYIDLAKECFTGDDSPQEKLRRYIREAIRFMRKNKELVAIAVSEFTNEMPEMAEFKARHMKQILDIVSTHLVPSIRGALNRPVRLEIIGPALAGLMQFHFIMYPVIEKLLPDSLDDRFYEEYTQEITNMALYGLLGRPESEAR